MPARILSTQQRSWMVTRYLESKNGLSSVRNDWPFHPPPPSKTTIAYVVEKFKETGSVQTKKEAVRKPHKRSPLSIANSAQVLDSLENIPMLSVRGRARLLGVPTTSVWRTLHAAGLRPFHPTWVQQLKPGDVEKRLIYCHTMLEHFQANQQLVDLIWWSDEAGSNLNGTVNRRNDVIWAAKNPSVQKSVQMKSKTITVWAAASAQGIIGPYFFHEEDDNMIGPQFNPCTVTSDRYLQMLEMFFQPRLFHLYDGDSWIGRDGGIAWPPRSPDLTPCHYGKELTFSKNPENLFQLQQAVCEAFEVLGIEYCQSLCRSVPRRLEACIEANGFQVSQSTKEN